MAKGKEACFAEPKLFKGNHRMYELVADLLIDRSASFINYKHFGADSVHRPAVRHRISPDKSY